MAYTKQTWTDRQGTKLNRFTKVNETLTSVELTNNPETITQAGTPFSKTRMDYIEEGIRTGHVIGTPLSNLNRVFHLTGNGVPMFPDNVAGTAYRNVLNWSTGVDGWTGNGGVVVSTSNGKLLLTSASTGNEYVTKNISINTTTNKIVSIRCRKEAGTLDSVRLSTNLGWTGLVFVPTADWQVFNFAPSNNWTGTLTAILLDTENQSADCIIEIDAIYVGSGLYDTPVYDKACCNRATNYGVLPVKGTRGQALSFTGGSYLQFDNPVIGTTGTIAFKLKDVTNGVICWNDSYNSNGIDIYYSSGKILVRFSYSGGNVQLEATVSGTGSFVLTFVNGDIKLYRDTMIIATSTFANITAGANNLKIGREFSGYYLTGVIDDFRYDARIWTQDDAIRYHNGDDAVDSQQKSATGTPHAIAVFGADGKLHATATQADNATQAGTATEVSNIGDTFIPELKFNGNNVGMTYDQRFGAWKRVGNCVFIRGFISISNIGSSTGDASITGFPFSTNIYLNSHMINITYDYVSYSGIPFGELSEVNQRIYLKTETASQLSANLTASSFGNNSNISFSGFYFID